MFYVEHLRGVSLTGATCRQGSPCSVFVLWLCLSGWLTARLQTFFYFMSCRTGILFGWRKKVSKSTHKRAIRPLCIPAMVKVASLSSLPMGYGINEPCSLFPCQSVWSCYPLWRCFIHWSCSPSGERMEKTESFVWLFAFEQSENRNVAKPHHNFSLFTFHLKFALTSQSSTTTKIKTRFGDDLRAGTLPANVPCGTF